jgi:hypothetical protein
MRTGARVRIYLLVGNLMIIILKNIIHYYIDILLTANICFINHT